MSKSRFRRRNLPWDETARAHNLSADPGGRTPIRPGWREGSGGAVGPSSSPGPSGPVGLTICKQIRHLPFHATIGIPAVSPVGAPLAAILQSARTMQQIMNANVLERSLRINLKCRHQHTAIAALVLCGEQPMPKDCTGTDIFIVVKWCEDCPAPAQAKTWVSLEPGWRGEHYG